MLAGQTTGTPAKGPRSRAPLPFHAMQASALSRLNQMKSTGRTSSSLTSSSSPPPLAPTGANLPRVVTTLLPSSTPSTSSAKQSDPASLAVPVQLIGRHEPASRSTAEATSSIERSAPSSSSSAQAAFEYEDYISFFDDFTSQESSHDISKPEQGLRESSLLPRQLNLHSSSSDDDEEDLRDLSALNFTKSIRMNLEALNRSSADYYAYNAEGYTDPNVPYGAKSVEDSRDSEWMEKSYAHLISALSLAQDGSRSQDKRSRHHVRSYERSDYDREQGTPKTPSSKDSPPAASLASGRSSSDAHEDEAQTPPEPSLERFDVTRETLSSSSPPPRPARRSPLPSQRVESSPSPDQAPATSTSANSQLGSPFQPSTSHFNQSQRNLDRPESHDAFGQYDIGDSSELEMLSDDVAAQRRAAGKSKMMPWMSDSASSSQSGHIHSRRGSSTTHTVFESNRPFTRLGPQDIVFSATTL